MKLIITVLVLHMLVINVLSQFSIHLQRIMLNSLSSSMTIPFRKQFPTIPQFTFAVQSLLVQQTQFSLTTQINQQSLTQFTITFNILLNSITPVWNYFDQVYVVGIFITSQWIQMGIVALGSLTNLVNYKQQHPYNSQVSYSLNTFTHNVPLTFSITNYQSTSFTLVVSTTGVLTNHIGYVLVQKIFQANNIFIAFDLITQSTLYFQLTIDNVGYMRPTDFYCFQGFSQLQYSSPSANLIRLAQYSHFYRNSPAIKIGYSRPVATLTKLRSIYINFNPRYRKCGSKKFLTYSVPFTTYPLTCQSCHSTCLTCTSSQQDSTYTDYRFCTTCPQLRYLQKFSTYSSGICKCLQGLNQDQFGNCIPCKFNCLTFDANLLRSTSQPKFLITFSFTNLTYLMNISDNLQIFIDDKQLEYNCTETSDSAYAIQFNSTFLEPCQSSCYARFYFRSPQSILSNSQFLTTQAKSLRISDFYQRNTSVPQQITTAIVVSSTIMAISSSSGQTSLIKILFQMQQTIEIHKYLNLQMPVIFKAFLEVLSSFKFLDITQLISYDINTKVQELSQDDIDSKGSPKIVYYEKGSNFYKNMVPVIISTFIILLINVLLFGIFRLIPLSFTRKFAQRMRIRWLITLSDNIQSAVLPISLFFAFQLNYTILKNSLQWVYALGYLFGTLIFIYPFFAVSIARSIFIKKVQDPNPEQKQKKYEYKFKQKLKQKLKQKQGNKNNKNVQQKSIKQKQQQQQQNQQQIDKQIIQDFLVDTKLSKTAYAFFIYNYLKKFIYGIVLGCTLAGLSQIFILIFLNIAHFGMMFFITKRKLYKGWFKIFARIGNLLCIMFIQGCILSYNYFQNTQSIKIILGYACSVFTAISTVLGIIQLLIKIYEIIKQKIAKNKSQQLEKQTLNYLIEQFIKKNNINGNNQYQLDLVSNIDFKKQQGKQKITRRPNRKYKPAYQINQNGQIQYKQKQKGKNKSKDKNKGNKIIQDDQWSRFSQNKKYQQSQQQKHSNSSHDEQFSKFDQQKHNKIRNFDYGSQDSDIIPINSYDTLYWQPQKIKNKQQQRPTSNMSQIRRQKQEVRRNKLLQERKRKNTISTQEYDKQSRQYYRNHDDSNVKLDDQLYRRKNKKIKKTLEQKNNNSNRIQINQNKNNKNYKYKFNNQEELSEIVDL